MADITKEYEDEKTRQKIKQQNIVTDDKKDTSNNSTVPKMTKEELIRMMLNITDDKEFWRFTYMESTDEFIYIALDKANTFYFAPLCSEIKHTKYESPLHDLARCVARQFYGTDQKSFQPRSLTIPSNGKKGLCKTCTDNLPACPYSAAAFIKTVCRANMINSEEVYAALAGELYKPMAFYRKRTNNTSLYQNEYDFLDVLSLVTGMIFVKENWIIYEKNGDDIRYTYVDFLKNPNMSMVPAIYDIYNGIGKVETLKASDFKNFILQKRNVADFSYVQEPDKVAAYLYFLAGRFNSHPMQIGAEILSKLSVLNTVYGDVMINVNRNKLHSIPFKNDDLKKADSIYNYIINYGLKQNVPYMPSNMIIYSSDDAMAEKLISVFDWVFMYESYFSRNTGIAGQVKKVSLADYSMDEIVEMINSIKLGTDKSFSSGDNIKAPVVFHITDMDMLPAKETRAGSNALAIAKLSNAITRKQDIMSLVISGEKTKLDKALKPFNEFYNRIMIHKLTIDDMPVERIVREILLSLTVNHAVEEGFEKELKNYTIQKYNDSDMKSHDLMEVIKQEILFNHYNKGLEVDKLLTIDEIPKMEGKKDDKDIWKEINELQGLNNIKEELKKLQSLLTFRSKTASKGISGIAKPNLHMVFAGNPGTGKTTVARLLGDILYNFGYIKQRKIVEVSSKDLVAQYVGQTAPKTAAACESAYGGILFVDEAYELATTGSGGSTDQFRSECVTELIKQMEDNRDRLVVIFAGYTKEMDELLETNAGFASRIGYRYLFEDYTDEELFTMFKNLAEKSGMKIASDVEDIIYSRIYDARELKDFGNGRFIRNLFEKTIITHAENTVFSDDENELLTITGRDIPDMDSSRKANRKNKIGFI